MSEYQFYEFLAVDKPLTGEEIVELRSISSRAEISSRRFCNTYNYGNLSASPKRMMEKYFDLHVYVSNWGVFNFMLRLPHEVIPQAILDQYAVDDELDYWTTDEHVIIYWFINDEEGGGWVEGEGWLDRLAPIREELERADYRSLYIGWLASRQYRIVGVGEEPECEDEETEDSTADVEPPVPPGLTSMSAAQKALAEFLEVDPDLLHAAAMASPEPSADEDSNKSIAEWVAQVPEHEAKEILLMILRGEGRKAERQVRSRYHEHLRHHAPPGGVSSPKRRTLRELRTIVMKARKARKRREDLERERRRAERERIRREYLTKVADNLPQYWQKADVYAEEKIASAYDSARDTLVDLHDAYKQVGRPDEFTEIFEEFISKYSRRPALLRRLKEAGMPGL